MNLPQHIKEYIVKDVMESHNKYYGSLLHQTQSFELFFGSTITQIVKENSEILVKHPDSPKTSVFSFLNVNISRPSMIEGNGFTKLVTPSDARARGLTYASTVLVDVIQETYDDIDTHNIIEKRTFKNVQLASLPVMVGTRYCNTWDMIGTEHECCYDQGGYFIINGIEKGFVSQEKLRINYPFIFDTKNSSNLVCEIRSCHENKLRSTSTLYVNVCKSPNNHVYSNISVVIPFIINPVPFSDVCTLLGDNTLHSIKKIVYDENDSEQVRETIKHIFANMVMSESYDSVVRQLCKRRNEKNHEDAHAYMRHITANEILPHIGIDNSESTQSEKLWYLGFIVRKLVRVIHKELSYDDRDHYAYKRVDTAGSLMSLLFRQLFRSHLKYATSQLTKYVCNDRIRNIMEFVSNKKITGGFRYAFATGNWGIQKSVSSQAGVVQVLSRLTTVGPISNLQRINTPLCREGKAPEPRQLHRSSWGLVCAAETPEGPSCGLMKNMCAFSHIRLGVDTPLMLDAMKHKLSIMECFVYGIPDNTHAQYPVFVNGQCVGYVHADKVYEFVDAIRSLRRSLLLPFDTSVKYVHNTKCIEITSDRGGMCRPVFVVSNMHKLESVYEKTINIVGTCLWNNLVAEGVIEYIDKEEEDTCRVAVYWDNVLSQFADNPNHSFSEVTLTNSSHMFTHCEIHPTVINGICAGQIPFSDHNQAPRNCYQSAMGKQAVGVYASNYLQRMDNVAHVLCQPQNPLVSTWTDEFQTTSSLPAGSNAIVAIMCWGGYNQEDSLIVNKTAIDNGMFMSLCYKTYKEEVIPNASDIETIQPPDPECCTNMKTSNYDKLGKSSTPLLETKLEDGDVIIGKTITTRSLHETNKAKFKVRMHDDSTCIKPNEKAVTDKIMTANNGTRSIVKVRTRQVRNVQVGDKLASRHGQKGVVGIIYDEKDMPFTTAGIRPDIIVNPHAIPSRMTIGMLVEMLLGKECIMSGEFGNGTPFRNTSVEQIACHLEQSGFERYGRENMFNAYTGEKLESQIFIAPAYYQRLKHMVIDKIHARGRGPVQLLTRQPNERRSRERDFGWTLECS